MPCDIRLLWEQVWSDTRLKVRICTIDIEVESENGFPDVESVSERINLISIKDSLTNRCYVFGLQPYYSDRDDISYMLCDSEEH